MHLWTFDIDFMNFVLGSHLVKPLRKKRAYLTSVNF